MPIGYARPENYASLSALVRSYVTKAELGKTGSCHLFRHTMATLMLEHGADIRYIQAMLGHAKLDTTQLYTRVSIQKLKQIHANTHPARLREAAPDDILSDWIQVIGIYVISVNKSMDNQQYKQTLESILPTQFEVGSFADRLLTRGRAEGREKGREEGLQEGREEGIREGMERGNLTGKIQVLSEMLGDPPVSATELQDCSQASLQAKLKELQDRLLDR